MLTRRNRSHFSTGAERAQRLPRRRLRCLPSAVQGASPASRLPGPSRRGTLVAPGLPSSALSLLASHPTAPEPCCMMAINTVVPRLPRPAVSLRRETEPELALLPRCEHPSWPLRFVPRTPRPLPEDAPLVWGGFPGSFGYVGHQPRVSWGGPVGPTWPGSFQKVHPLPHPPSLLS